MSNASLPDELSYLITAFLPSHPSATRSKAYLTLSAFCQGVRSSSPVKGKQPNPATEALVKVFEPLIIPQLVDTEESSLIAGASFLTALFQVDWEAASFLFQQDGVLEAAMDSVDLTPSAQLARTIVYLLAQACGHKVCRAVLTPQSVEWLGIMSRTSTDMILRAGATNALIKMSKGSAADNPGTGGTETGTRKDEDLAGAMKDIVIAGSDMASTSDAVEGLAYLSVEPDIKEILSRDSTFLRCLFTLIPRRPAYLSTKQPEPTTTVVFGILVIISNLCAYRPRLTEEQSQIEKLRRMAKASDNSMKAPSVLDDDENVKGRIKRLLDAGVLDVFAAAIRTDSSGIRITIGKALISIIEDKENRGKALQSGGAKILGQIIKHASTSASKSSDQTPTIDSAYLDSIQALAKLAITSSPVQVFGPNAGAMYDAIRPFSFMLQSPSSTLLQRFESMMALTNLSSYSAETAARIAQTPNLMNQVELLLLEEHALVRRAAMELLCNLIAGSDEVFERYGGETNSSSTKSRLQVVLALCDVDDLPTRLAASGALATLTAAPSACKALVSLQTDRRRVFLYLAQLIDPSITRAEDSDEVNAERENESHPGLVHRAIVCARNIFVSIDDQAVRKRLSKDAEDAGLTQALVIVVKGQIGSAEEAILRPTAETLKILMDSKT
jgi:hypothetical protein